MTTRLEAHAKGAEVERARIVAWLREVGDHEGSGLGRQVMITLANAIERGDHLKGKGDG